MLKEYAVDPKAMVSSYDTCRFLLSQFGVDKGRLIARFPKRWKRLAIEAADNLPDGLKKERVFEHLTSINDQWLILIASGRAYDSNSDWLANAKKAHKTRPFHAILCCQDNESEQLIDVEVCDDKHPLFSISTTRAVRRTSSDIASAAGLLVENCRVLRLIDPYFDPNRPKWQSSLKAILEWIPDISKTEIECHRLEKPGSPSTTELKTHLARLRGSIPEGGSLKLVRWKEKENGERFHDRYILTNNGGLGFAGGIDPGSEGQTTDVSLLSNDHHAARWRAFDLDAHVFELVGPVLGVDSKGVVSEVDEQ